MPTPIFGNMAAGRIAGTIPTAVLALNLFGGGIVLGSYIDTAAARQRTTTPALTTSSVVISPQPTTSATVDFDRFARTELYFGSERPDETEISEEDWQRFLDEVITPRFPDGLTVLTGFGQFRGADGTIDEETSRVLVLLYPVEVRKQANQDIEYIRREFKVWFEQESVLRVDDRNAAFVSF